MAVEIRPVSGARDRHRFVDVPFRLFRADPDWLAPLRRSVLDRISPQHPANEHQVSRQWIAYRDGEPVGRIGACVDRFFNDYQGVLWGWVGFFEVADDPGVVAALFEVAWLKLQGATTAVGRPRSQPTTRPACWSKSSTTRRISLCVHNPRYYERLWVTNGWEPAMDLWAWKLVRGGVNLDERQRRTLQRLKDRAKVTIRPMRMKDFDAEVKRLFEVYNAAWSKGAGGFAPRAQGAEIKHLAKSMKQLVIPDLTLVVEKPDGEPVGVAIVLPDVNQVMPSFGPGACSRWAGCTSCATCPR